MSFDYDGLSPQHNPTSVPGGALRRVDEFNAGCSGLSYFAGPQHVVLVLAQCNALKGKRRNNDSPANEVIFITQATTTSNTVG